MAILDFVNKITDSIDDGGTSIGVFLDLSKTFDTVNDDILLDKLSYYGINNETKDWFSSYLKNRKQYVCVDGVNSNILPQSGIWGTTWFCPWPYTISYIY